MKIRPMLLGVRLLFFLILGSFGIFSHAQTCKDVSLSQEMVLNGSTPYSQVTIGKHKGLFLIDFGTTTSTIDLNSFLNGKPQTNAAGTYDTMEFLGVWKYVALRPQDHRSISGIKQSGILGTDFLSQNIYRLDYDKGKIALINKRTVCSVKLMDSLGYDAVSAQGYYSNDLNKINNDCTANVPTVPIKIGNIQAVAQLDTGYDDRLHPYSININQALYDALIEADIQLERNDQADLSLSSCVLGVTEYVKAYRLPKEVYFSMVDIKGEALLQEQNVTLFLKPFDSVGLSCGGIGEWTIPAAQLGASFLKKSGSVLFDPFGAKVYFKKP